MKKSEKMNSFCQNFRKRKQLMLSKGNQTWFKLSRDFTDDILKGDGLQKILETQPTKLHSKVKMETNGRHLARVTLSDLVGNTCIYSFIGWSLQYQNLIKQMSEATLLVPNHFHSDAVSEASTDGDDYQMPAFSSKVGKKKTCPKNKAKSSLCRNFSEKGYCPYGYKCQFAHGIEELKCNVDQNAYKTKPCNAFWRKGHCPYGFRCNFSHSQAQEHEGEPVQQRMMGSLKSFRDLIYESKRNYGSKLATILE